MAAQRKTQVEAQLGATGQEIFYATVAGTIVNVEGEEIDPVGQVAFGEPVPGCVSGSGTYTCTNAFFQTSELPIDFGVPTTFAFGLLNAIQAADSQTIDSDPPISLSSIQVYNADGQQISDFTIQSGSGAVYGADGIESEPSGTPEPSTVLLAGLGLTTVGILRRRRNR